MAKTAVAPITFESKHITSKVDRARVGRLLATLHAPDGFTQTMGDDDWLGSFTVTWATPDKDIVIQSCVYTRSQTYWERPKGARKNAKEVRVTRQVVEVSGHVDFDTVHGRLTFDSFGVSDAFNWDSSMRYNKRTLNEEMLYQIERARESQTKHAGINYKTCPRVNTLITPDQFDAFKKKLQAQQTITLTPGGMGTGWRITRNAPRGGDRMGWSRADDFSKFFDMFPLYAQAFDHD